MEDTSRSKEKNCPKIDDKSIKILCPGSAGALLAQFGRTVNYLLAILFPVFDHVENTVPE